jgi:hypothetical protein
VEAHSIDEDPRGVFQTIFPWDDGEWKVAYSRGFGVSSLSP